MAKEGDYNIRPVYQGGMSSFSPGYGDVFTGYRVAASNIGANTKPDTANQIQQVNQLLNQGIVPIEITVLQPETFDQIPQQHFKEIGRLSKLAGGKMSVHAPIIEPSGIAEQGWSEENRVLAEKQLMDVVDRSVDIDPTGGMPVTIHASGIPGSEYEMTPDGKKMKKMIVINQETGKMNPIVEEVKYYPETRVLKEGVTPEDMERVHKGELDKSAIYEDTPLARGKILNLKTEIDSQNATDWDNSLSQIVFYKEGADRIIAENMVLLEHLQKDQATGNYDPKHLKGYQKQAHGHIENAQVYLQNTRQYISGLFNKAYKYGSDEDKEILQEASNQFKKDLDKEGGITQQSEALQNLILNLKKVNPRIFIPIEEFAIKNASETFANVAFNTFKKYKDKSPTISIENLYPGMAFSMGKEMDELITTTRKKFVKKAMSKGYSRGESESQADKMIGMTFDVGHLNIAKKHGFKDEDLAKEASKFAKYVKHVHLTDNFGYSDSHLPPGMGNVPIKDLMEEIEKKGGDPNEIRKIVEAGGFVQHFGSSPYPINLEGLGSPIYSTGGGGYWNQVGGLAQNYFGGYGNFLPQINYETFGSGFSQLPMELGGQRGGVQGSRMSGTPME